MTFGGFVNDIYEYGLLFDHIDSLGIPSEWTRALDIGCAEGAIPRLMKGSGTAEVFHGIDINDMSDQLSTHRFLRFHTMFTGGRLDRRLIPPLRSRWDMHVSEGTFRYRDAPSSRFWKPRLRRSPTIDQYIIENVVEYDFAERYDLKTGFLCLEDFDLQRIFERVHSLLSPGGTLAFLVN